MLWADRTTAQHYGQLKADLRTLGRPLPENDIWIAALALQHNLVVVTRDAHFGQAPLVGVGQRAQLLAHEIGEALEGQVLRLA